jgi:hypothetical protein
MLAGPDEHRADDGDGAARQSGDEEGACDGE